MDQYIGRLLDNRYELLDIIGSGGMAVVYKARDLRLNRLVAVKILKDEHLEDEDFVRRFHAESETVANLSHPNIVSVYDVSKMEGSDYIVMELLDGVTLKQYIERKHILNWRETVHFAIMIAKALEHAHSKKLVHRDIKPHNVMVLTDGSAKVMDFGIARNLENNNTVTRFALGTAHYLSPEQAKGSAVDERSDIYSLGVVMYEMITGRPPFDAENPVAIALQHINGGARLPSELVSSIPRGLEQIIMHAMAHDVNRRYASAADLLRDLTAFRANPELIFDYDDEGAQSFAQQADSSGHTGRHGQRESHRRVVSRMEEAEEESEQPKGKLGTIAVIICSLAAIVAIIVFMILLTQKDVGISKEDLPQEQTSQTLFFAEGGFDANE